MPALWYTLASFALILLLGRLRVPLALAILAGTIAAGFLFGLSPGELLRALPAGALQPKSCGLLAITAVQLQLSGCMDATGQLRRIVELARAVCRRPALTMAALPALIGLLPMPGGALFSAPMVEAAAGNAQPASGSWLSAVNYWYRHIWEHWWPLYPGVLLAMTLTDRQFGAFARIQFPLGLFMAVAGLLLFRGIHADFHAVGAPPAPGTWGALARTTASIWLIIVVWVPAAWLVRFLPLAGLAPAVAQAIQRFGPILAGMSAGLFWTILAGRLPARTVGRLCARGSLWSMLGLVLSVMAFQGVLERVEAAPRIAAELATGGVPTLLAVVLLPFIAGMVTGLAFGFVGASFPIVLGLVQAMGVAHIGPHMALAYACGHFGQMLSPIHLCYVVSNRYFKTPFAPVYRHLLPPVLLTALLTALYFIALRALLG
jgi:hypothetical protein